jgi:cation diffusion facilitator CzcD-associated flavoprotein CzcO
MPRTMRTPEVVIVGAGVSGMCTAIRLRQAGIESFTVLEKGDRVGGTWRDNRYPGLFCDVPSRYFQYSFATSGDWTRRYSPGPEIDDYLQRVAREQRLHEKIVFGTEVREARWENGRWAVETSDGTVRTADFVVTACGFLHRPSFPDIPGLGAFAGPCFHSSRWPAELDLRGRRVGVIGTGSTGVQLVAALAGETGALTQFTRTPQWVAPAGNPRYRSLTRWLYRRSPALQRLGYRAWQRLYDSVLFVALVRPGWQRRVLDLMCRANLWTVRDATLRRALTPSYQPGCKRLVMSGGYYRQVQKHGVAIVREAVTRVEPDAVITADGARHALDVLVLATGFDTHALVRPMEIVGPGGVRLSELWANGPTGYATVAVPGLPNLFMTMGPNSPVNDSSMFNVAETQVDYVMRIIERWRRGEIDAIAPRADAAIRFNQSLRDGLQGTVWTTGCDSWYIGPDGTPVIWPWLPQRHRELLAETVLADYEPVA